MITIKKTKASGTIIMDRADNRNALSRAMLRALSEAFFDLHQEKNIRAVILTGAGPAFSSGVDLREWAETSQAEDALEQWKENLDEFYELLETMLRFPKPIIAAVDGAAIGGGFALVLASDLVVASQRSTFSLPSAKIGLVAGIAAPLLHFRLGGATAARVLLGMEEIDIDQAKNLGLVHHVVGSDQIWVRAEQWAQELMQCAPEAIRLSKRVLNEMIGESMLVQLANGAAATATGCTTDAAKEGLAAFRERRPPQW